MSGIEATPINIPISAARKSLHGKCLVARRVTVKLHRSAWTFQVGHHPTGCLQVHHDGLGAAVAEEPAHPPSQGRWACRGRIASGWMPTRRPRRSLGSPYRGRILGRKTAVVSGAGTARIAFIACRECKRDISSEAPSCPHCGVPNPGAQADQVAPPPTPTSPPQQEAQRQFEVLKELETLKQQEKQRIAKENANALGKGCFFVVLGLVGFFLILYLLTVLFPTQPESGPDWATICRGLDRALCKKMYGR